MALHFHTVLIDLSDDGVVHIEQSLGLDDAVGCLFVYFVVPLVVITHVQDGKLSEQILVVNKQMLLSDILK